MVQMNKRPGGELATRPLHFIFMADCSGSMGIDGKIQALNTAIREAIRPTTTMFGPSVRDSFDSFFSFPCSAWERN